MNNPIEQINSDEQAESFVVDGLDGFSYRMLALTQYRLSRQQNKTIQESLSDSMNKLIEITTKVIDGYKKEGR